MFVGEISALVAALLWASGSFLFTSAALRIGSIQLNIDRMALASVFIFITMLITGISFNISMYQIGFLAMSGFVGLIIGDSFLFSAFKSMGPRISLLIYSINPAIASILAYILFDEVLPWISIFGIVAALSGIAIVVTEKPKGELSQFKVSGKAIFAAFMSAVGQAGGLILAKYAFNSGDIHSFTATFYRISTSVLLMLPMAYLLKKYKNPFKLYNSDRKSLKMIGIGSIIGPYLGITLSFVAITSTKLGIASTLLSTVPIMILPMSIIVYKEKLSYRSILGAVVAFAGITLLFLNDYIEQTVTFWMSQVF